MTICNTFSQLGPRTSSTDSESEHNIEPLIKQSKTQQQTFEQHLYTEMSQPINTTPANQQISLSTFINPAGILGYRIFRLLLRNSSNSFYNVFRKSPIDSPDISTTIQQEHWPKYAQPDKFDGNLRNYQKWKKDYLLYMLAHNNNFPDEHTVIIFMLYHINKKTLV